MARRSKTKRKSHLTQDSVREEPGEQSPWICVRVYHAMGTLVSDSPTEGMPKEGSATATSGLTISDSVATGCLANELGLALLLIVFAPFLVSLLGAAILDVLWFPFRIVRDQLT